MDVNIPLLRQSSGNNSSILKLLAGFAVLQVLYWAVFHPYFVTYSPDRVPFFPISAVEIAEVQGADSQDILQAEFKPYQPKPEPFSEGYYALRATYEIEAVPASGAALLGVTQSDNQRYFVNGKLLKSFGSMDLNAPHYKSNMKRIEQIPPSMLVAGTNTVETVMVFNVGRTGLAAPPSLAEYGAAVDNFGWTEFLNSDWRNVTLTMTFVIALLVGAVALRSTERAVPAWLFVLTASWAGHTVMFQWVNMPLFGNSRAMTYAFLYLVSLAAFPCFVDAWSRKPVPYFRWLILGLALAAILYVAYVLYISDVPIAFDEAAVVLDAFATFFVLAMVGRVIWHFARTPSEDRYWEGAVLLLIAFIAALATYESIFLDRNIGYLQKAQPVLVIALAIGFFANRFHLFKSANDINSLLQEKLDVREKELAVAYAREADLIRRETLNEERQRIMRDMHDGLGSQLMSMLLAARRGKADPPRVAGGLQQVVDEMRLMIDSMDSLGESVSSAVASFRTRVQPRVEDAGFDFVWVEDISQPLPQFTPRKTMQIFRIMQESVTNALKHSGGNRVTVSISYPGTANEGFSVAVADNGTGQETARDSRNSGGHGLASMRARASSIGAGITLENAKEGGMHVLLDVPVTADAEGSDGQAD